MKRMDGFWLSFAQALVMGLIIMFPLFVVGEVWRIGVEPTPVATMTPLPLPTIVTLAPLPTLTPTLLVLPTVTPTPFVFPTATPTPDAVMTEIARAVGVGDLISFTAETPAVKHELVGTPFALCVEDYAGICVPHGLDRAWCYDMGGAVFQVVGEDVLGFDKDGDGVACEAYDDWQPN